MSYTLRNGKLDPSPDIEIVGPPFNGRLSHDAGGILDCPICSQRLGQLSVFQRQEHVEKHFSSSQEHSSPSRRGGTLPKLSPINKVMNSSKKIFRSKGKEKEASTNADDVFWYPVLSSTPPRNYTPGLVPLLRKALLTSHASGATRRAALCYEHSVHIRGTWDRSWGCGHRNFLMACAALMTQRIQPEYQSLLNEPLPPSIRNLQVVIEDAWNAGFDEEGAAQLEKLVGTKKWIGTADLWLAFIYRGIPAELVDFDVKNEPRGVEIVSEWIVNYFTPNLSSAKATNINDALRGASPVVITDCMPLILQHKGHSRTIVGYEVRKDGKTSLLTFDPSTFLSKDIHKMATSSLPHSTLSYSTRTSAPSISRRLQNEKSRKRPPGSSASVSRPSNKRVRSSSMDVIPLEDDRTEVVVISDSQDTHPQEDPRKSIIQPTGADLRHLLDNVRLDMKRLRKNEYQILYFPMRPPLSVRAKDSMKRVTSTRIC